jgi:putative transposase
LLKLPRSTYYYHHGFPGEEELMLRRRIDEIYTMYPFYGSRRIVAELRREGVTINRKKVQRIMGILGLAGCLPGISTSKSCAAHYKFPYLLRGIQITKPVQVWSTDITYIRLPQGFIYLTAVMDWYSRLVLSSRISNSLEGSFCLEAVEEAIDQYGCPEILNTDQGVQFTCQKYVEFILNRGIRFSMDGRGRALDNVFIERLWRSLKYEEVYLNDYQCVEDAKRRISEYFRFYNEKRLHQSLGYHTPFEVHYKRIGEKRGRGCSAPLSPLPPAKEHSPFANPQLLCLGGEVNKTCMD